MTTDAKTNVEKKGLWEQNTDIHNENYVGTFVHFVIKRFRKEKENMHKTSQVSKNTDIWYKTLMCSTPLLHKG